MTFLTSPGFLIAAVILAAIVIAVALISIWPDISDDQEVHPE